MLGSFFTRRVFAQVLGLDTVGIEGVFLNIVSMLGIVEMGLGVNIIYMLYKPIAENDYKTISTILKFLKKAYTVIAGIILLLGVIIALFVGSFIGGDYSSSWLSFIFMLYVADVLASYLYAHKRAMFIADQKNYVNNLIRMTMQVLGYITQIVLLKQFKSLEIYLLAKIVFRVLENLMISAYFKKQYGHLDLKTKTQLPKEDKNDLLNNIKAILMHKIAGFSLTSTSNIIISKFVNIQAVGKYQNYALIVNSLIGISNEIFNGVVASFGNLLSTENEDKVYGNFKVIYFSNYLIYSFFAISFFTLANPFVSLWIGKEAVFDVGTLLAISVYLYMVGIRQSLLMAKTSAGIYKQDQYFAVLEAVLTLILSMLLAKRFGVKGVMFANIISMALVPMWTQPYLVFRLVFKKPLGNYYVKYMLYAALTAALGFATYTVANLTNLTGSALLAYRAAVCLVIPNAVNLLIFFKTKEFSYLKSLAGQMAKRLTHR